MERFARGLLGNPPERCPVGMSTRRTEVIRGASSRHSTDESHCGHYDRFPGVMRTDGEQMAAHLRDAKAQTIKWLTKM